MGPLLQLIFQPRDRPWNRPLRPLICHSCNCTTIRVDMQQLTVATAGHYGVAKIGRTIRIQRYPLLVTSSIANSTRRLPMPIKVPKPAPLRHAARCHAWAAEQQATTQREFDLQVIEHHALELCLFDCEGLVEYPLPPLPPIGRGPSGPSARVLTTLFIEC